MHPKAIMDKTATHCELDEEFHVLQTGQIYKASHFSARNLCSKDRYLKHSNLCAGIGIIGPISDLEHVSNKAVDMKNEEMGLKEDQDWEKSGIFYHGLTDEQFAKLDFGADEEFSDEDDYDDYYDESDDDDDFFDDDDSFFDDDDDDYDSEEEQTDEHNDDTRKRRGRRVLKSQKMKEIEEEERRKSHYS